MKHYLTRLSSIAVFVAAGLMLTVLQPAAAALPEQFNLAPKDAQVVALVKNMQSLNDKFTAFAEKIGAPADKDLFDMMDQGNFKKGINRKGSMLLTVTDAATAMEKKTNPDMVVLLPVTDYNEFLSNFNATDAGGVTTVQHMNKTFYVKSIPGYAVFSEYQKPVEAYEPGNGLAVLSKKVGSLGLQFAEADDFIVYADLKAMAPVLEPLVKQMMEQQIQQMQQLADMGFMDASTVQNATMAFKMYDRAIRGVIRGSDAILISGRFTDDGLIASKAMNMLADSEMAKMFPGDNAGVASILASLPNQPYIFNMAVNTKALDVKMLVDELMESMPKPAEGEAAGGDMMDIYRKMLPMVDQIKAFASAFYSPDQQAMMTGGLLKTVSIFDTEDGATFVKDYGDYIKETNGIKIPMGQIPDANGNMVPMEMSYTTNLTPKALQIDGIDLDQYALTMNMPPQMMQQMGPAAMFMSSFTNYQGFLGAKKNRVMVTTTLDPAMAKQVLAHMDKATGMGSAGPMKSAMDKLDAPNPFMVYMLSPDGIAQAANIFMMMFQMPDIQVPDNLEPMTAVVGSEDLSLGGQLYVPSRSVRFIVDTVKQFAGPAMGGPGGHGRQKHSHDGPPPAPF